MLPTGAGDSPSGWIVTDVTMLVTVALETFVRVPTEVRNFIGTVAERTRQMDGLGNIGDLA